MKVSVSFLLCSLFCLLSYSNSYADVIQSTSVNGVAWIAIKNSAYEYFPYRKAEFYQVASLDQKLEKKATEKNLIEIQQFCSNYKKEEADKPFCNSEEVYSSKGAGKRICEVVSYFSCK